MNPLITTFLGGPEHLTIRGVQPDPWTLRVATYRLEKVAFFGRAFRVYVHESLQPGSPAADEAAMEAFLSPLALGLIRGQAAR